MQILYYTISHFPPTQRNSSNNLTRRLLKLGKPSNITATHHLKPVHQGITLHFTTPALFFGAIEGPKLLVPFATPRFSAHKQWYWWEYRQHSIRFANIMILHGKSQGILTQTHYLCKFWLPDLTYITLVITASKNQCQRNIRQSCVLCRGRIRISDILGCIKVDLRDLFLVKSGVPTIYC